MTKAIRIVVASEELTLPFKFVQGKDDGEIKKYLLAHNFDITYCKKIVDAFTLSTATSGSSVESD